jgi:hypothetical protein
VRNNNHHDLAEYPVEQLEAEIKRRTNEDPPPATALAAMLPPLTHVTQPLYKSIQDIRRYINEARTGQYHLETDATPQKVEEWIGHIEYLFGVLHKSAPPEATYAVMEGLLPASSVIRNTFMDWHQQQKRDAYDNGTPIQFPMDVWLRRVREILVLQGTSEAAYAEAAFKNMRQEENQLTEEWMSTLLLKGPRLLRMFVNSQENEWGFMALRALEGFADQAKAAQLKVFYEVVHGRITAIKTRDQFEKLKTTAILMPALMGAPLPIALPAAGHMRHTPHATSTPVRAVASFGNNGYPTQTTFSETTPHIDSAHAHQQAYQLDDGRRTMETARTLAAYAAPQTGLRNMTGVKCYNCQQMGHIRNACPHPPQAAAYHGQARMRTASEAFGHQNTRYTRIPSYTANFNNVSTDTLRHELNRREEDAGWGQFTNPYSRPQALMPPTPATGANNIGMTTPDTATPPTAFGQGTNALTATATPTATGLSANTPQWQGGRHGHRHGGGQ